MKKLHLLLFVLALNPLPLNSNPPKSAMCILKSVMSDPSTLILAGTTLTSGTFGLCFLKNYWYYSKKATEKESTNSDKDPLKEGTIAASFPRSYRENAASSRKWAIIGFSAAGIAGFILAADLRNKILN
jgi:hypothetical protein